jgi:predicted nicotinamide N-methyase
VGWIGRPRGVMTEPPTGLAPRRSQATITPPARPDLATFIRDNTRLRTVPHVPEIALYVADEAVPLWHKTEAELGAIGLPPPFWAFAWAGGQALARYVMDHPALVCARRVLDLASGSGLAAIAAAKAGGVPVIASEIDAFAQAAIALNADCNDVYVEILGQDLLDHPTPLAPRYDVILVGDLFYERETAQRALAFLERHAKLGTKVLIGDPGRTYLPTDRLAKQCEYTVPVTRDLEDQSIKRTAVFTLI